MALVLALLALAPPREGWPATAWLAAAAGPLVLLAFIHALPLGWHHPWITADLTALATQGAAPDTPWWSIDAGRSLDSASWIGALTAACWCLLALFPGRRLPQLADGVALVLTAYATWSLALSIGGDLSGHRGWAVGGFAYHNHAGAAWAACLPLALVRARECGGWRWILPPLLMLALVHSASRGAIIIGCAVSAPLLVVLLPRARCWPVAAGVAAGLLLVFTLFGTGAAVGRFRDLGEGSTATTLNGRVTIWRAAQPVIADAQPFGSGVGTAGLAMQRGLGIDATGDIVHLHSEPLELLLEVGWVGVLAIAAGLAAAIALLRRVRNPLAGDGGARIGLGAGLGLAVLVLHSVTDYILHNPAIDLIAVALLALWVQGQVRPRTQAGAWRRAPAVACAAVLLMLSMIAVQREFDLRADPQAHATEAATHSADAAVARAEALLDAPEQARAWLAHAAGLAPGSAAAWRVRTLLATRQGQTDAALIAAGRLLAWAPDRDAAQDTALACLERLSNTQAGDPRAQAIARTLMGGDRAWTEPAWNTLARTLGANAVAGIASAHPHPAVRTAALPWLAHHADLATWQRARRSLPAGTLDPVQWRIVGDDGDPRPFTVAIANDHEGRLEQATRCLRTGLGLPPALADTLATDGTQGALMAQVARALTSKATPTLRADLDRALHLPWARAWWKLLHEREELAAGRWAALDAQSEPPLLAQAASSATQAGDTAAAKRLRTLLTPLREPATWIDAGRGVRWCWILGEEGNVQATVCRGWTAVYLDGRWLGWKRGLLDLGALAGSGAHRVVLADPP